MAARQYTAVPSAPQRRRSLSLSLDIRRRGRLGQGLDFAGLVARDWSHQPGHVNCTANGGQRSM